MTGKMMPTAAGNIAPGRSVKMNKIEQSLKQTVLSYGYMEIFLPVYEYYDILKATSLNLKDENTIQFIDRNTGKSLVLRPDFTPQAARYFANYMADFPLPARVCYDGRVFRNVNLNKGVKSEQLQVGAELYGNNMLEADTELLMLSKRAFNDLNVKGCKYVFGHSGFTRRALELAGDKSEKYHSLLDSKNVASINAMITGNSDTDKFLKYLPKAFGGIETIEQIIKASAFDAELTENIGYIKALFENMIRLGFDKEDLVFDASESRGLDYYTGITFDVLHAEVGENLAGGGRYDNLTKNFGRDIPACGVVFNIEEIYRVDKSEVKLKEIDWLIIGEENFAKSEELRNEGNTVFYAGDAKEKSELEKSYSFRNILS
ncbi:MAG: ATP phosphoribosyltransferase regulatory subunit [Denitrovibrio sp.]|nr:MAG: ATP phosphoribosyltransferase regulatory subunit [Denitrovibrio sp.]